MNLKKAKKSLEKLFAGMDLGFEFEIEGNCLRATNNITIDGYDDDILANLNYYENGTCQFRFIFDQLPVNFETLSLINNFNLNTYGLKAYISEKNYLEVAYEAEDIEDSKVADFASLVLDDLLDKDTDEYLLPLSKLTK